ncbi:hypothetical protein JL720_15479 [Aureococcus anophagefferens]|nr:hypothetical protein JL720_15479 [Aureococcus anophagefferens]
MAEDDEQPAEEAGGETEAASAWNILQSPAGKLVAAAGGGFVAYQCLRAASAIGDTPARVQRDLLEQTFTFGKKKSGARRRRRRRRGATTTTTTATEAAEAAPAAEVDDADEPVAVDDPKKIISRDLLIAYDQENPKRPGTNSHFRYEAYKRATAARPSSSEAVADLRYDLGRGFVVAGAPRRAHKNCGALVVAVPKTSTPTRARVTTRPARQRCEPAAESGLYGRKRKQRTRSRRVRERRQQAASIGDDVGTRAGSGRRCPPVSARSERRSPKFGDAPAPAGKHAAFTSAGTGRRPLLTSGRFGAPPAQPAKGLAAVAGRGAPTAGAAPRRADAACFFGARSKKPFFHDTAASRRPGPARGARGRRPRRWRRRRAPASRAAASAHAAHELLRVLRARRVRRRGFDWKKPEPHWSPVTVDRARLLPRARGLLRLEVVEPPHERVEVAEALLRRLRPSRRRAANAALRRRVLLLRRAPGAALGGGPGLFRRTWSASSAMRASHCFLTFSVKAASAATDSAAAAAMPCTSPDTRRPDASSTSRISTKSPMDGGARGWLRLRQILWAIEHHKHVIQHLKLEAIHALFRRASSGNRIIKRRARRRGRGTRRPAAMALGAPARGSPARRSAMRLALLAAACPYALALPWSRIACMGDSITRGDTTHTDEPGGQARPGQLPENVGKPPGVDVENFGASARRVGQAGLRRHQGRTRVIQRRFNVGTDEYEDAVDFDPDCVVVMLGINDAKLAWDEDDFVEAYADLVEKRSPTPERCDASDVDGACEAYYDDDGASDRGSASSRPSSGTRWGLGAPTYAPTWRRPRAVARADLRADGEADAAADEAADAAADARAVDSTAAPAPAPTVSADGRRRSSAVAPPWRAARGRADARARGRADDRARGRADALARARAARARADARACGAPPAPAPWRASL